MSKYSIFAMLAHKKVKIVWDQKIYNVYNGHSVRSWPLLSCVILTGESLEAEVLPRLHVHLD